MNDAASPSVLDLFALTGRVAVVTGAGSGLGAGFAVALAEAGADVVLAARRADRIADVAERVRANGRQALAVPTDVTIPEECNALALAAIDTFGRIDVLVNNAGITHSGPALREDPEVFRSVVDVNLLGAYWAARACAAHMKPGSAIVNVSSMLGLVKSVLPQAAYASSKAGLLGLTRDLSAQWSGRKGIRVNAVAPGFIATDMVSEMPDEAMTSFLQGCSLGRVATQREIDAAVVFLASPAASYITGSTLAVDGGTSGH
ncbi:short-chain dehydrogenase [Rhodococcus sp. 14-2686-1-2]|nr:MULTISPECIES: glucose 1-dehydrogenase [unclassified Rhodococcus (in: high G+C Gram-positive bacteria)]OZE93173.1 short-chain dehydrogenase [Rhodococcus sp. 15-1189-1-1a]OZF08291.1 short-chain dehydrogenase [Rhodococcus sp. 14-2686-1-2]